MDGQPDGRHRWFTVTRDGSRTIYAIWAIDPIKHAPAGDRFSEVIKLADTALESEDITGLYDMLGAQIGARIEIPDGRRLAP